MAHLKTLATIYYNMREKDFTRPRIILAPPVRGRRESICKSDEARVGRMIRPEKYAGMVERLQVGDNNPFSKSMKFVIFPSPDGDNRYPVNPADPSNPLLRFLSLRFARSLFPDNFVDMRELRISKKTGGKLVSAMYSDYVPDATGVIPRRDEYFRKFYGTTDGGRQKNIQQEAMRIEHESCATLSNVSRMMDLAGIIVPYPEFNYHVSNGKVVFFEVLGIDFPQAFAAVNDFAPGIGEPIVLLSMIYGVMLRNYSMRNPGYVSRLGGSYDGLDFDAITLSALCGLLEMSDSPAQLQRGFFRDVHTILHDVFERAIMVREGLKRDPIIPEYPVWLDPALK
jgi:hypothetical protein